MSEHHDHTASRPLSPHLQVYKLPYNAKLSIIGRGIGIGLSVAVSLILLCFVVGVWVPSFYAAVVSFLGLPFMGILMVLASAIVFFYLGNGVRHVLWDYVVGVHHEKGFMTGHIAIAVAAILGAIVAMFAFGIMG